MIRATTGLALAAALLYGDGITGRVADPQGRPVPRAIVRLETPGRSARAETDGAGAYRIEAPAGAYRLSVEASGFQTLAEPVVIPAEPLWVHDVQLALAAAKTSIVIGAHAVEPALDFSRVETTFTRDDQLVQQLDAGIDAGQHEGGGKSLEIRRFGFNLDHGGVNGGLKVLVDDVQQNQGTQGHGQGYLGALKALTPELIEDVTIVDGPFRAEYGDFSGLGVVHIRQRESLPDQITARLEGGPFHNRRAFVAFSPDLDGVDAYVAYEGAYTDGPFQSPGRYRRDNFNANLTRTLSAVSRLGVRLLLGRNDFDSSGQLPLDLVAAGALDRFGYVDPTDGGRVRLGTASLYYSRQGAGGGALKLDGFVSRSLFDLYSNFTFFRDEPARGDAFQQHDSRLQEGVNAQYLRPHRLGAAVLVAGANFHDNQINVGLYSREGREPLGVTLRAHARVTNAAGYAQESVSLLRGRVQLSGGVRFDEFRYAIGGSALPAGRWQGKGSAAWTVSHRAPVVLSANYGRGINSADARGVAARPGLPRLATTDFYEAGVAWNRGRFGASVDAFRIDHSNEQVYVPDDGSFEFHGPSRAYGYEAKTSLAITRRVTLRGGVTKVANAYYLGGDHRTYVDSAPHFVASAALTAAPWRGWSGSLRMRAINHYRLDGGDASIVAAGHTVFDASLTRRLRRGVELNLALDNLTNRDYYETQNYFESRVSPEAPVVARIHGTPGYPLSAVVGLTFRLRGK
jgi:hypothetical protein